jgi:hypothetical protein
MLLLYTRAAVQVKFLSLQTKHLHSQNEHVFVTTMIIKRVFEEHKIDKCVSQIT